MPPDRTPPPDATRADTVVVPASGTGDPGRRPSPEIPEKIGDYRILRALGAGGMGVVYLAEQEGSLRRQVALKVIRPDFATEDVLSRFENERRALALMNHESIARVHDAGTTAHGQPFFVMEYVDGPSITQYCDERHLTVDERLELFIRVCQGVQHAHQKAVIHRDLKPSNILVVEQDGRAVPKIIDFGVAKATGQRPVDATMITRQGQWVGTLEYMSPEQFEPDSENVDTRTDIYSLGVVLYELLVGAQPFDERRLRLASLLEAYRVIREEDPPKPSTRLKTLGETATGPITGNRPERERLGTRLRGDLDWITMRALEKDRNRRYASAGDLALDIQRHLDHEPVLASPPSTTYVLAKLVRRHRVMLVAAGVVLLAILGGAVLSTVLWFRAERAATTARQERDRSDEVAGLMKEMLKGAGPSAALGHDTRLLRDILDRTARRLDAAGDHNPLVQSEMLAVIGATYMDLGEYEAARPRLEKALALRRTAAGERDPGTLELVAAMGQLQYRLGDMAAAESLLTWAGDEQAAALGPEHEATLTTRVSLVETLGYMGKLDEADSLGTPLLATLRRVAGDTAEVTRSAMFALAQTYTDMDRLAAAESLYLEQRDILVRTVGPEHPNTLSLNVNLGWLYRLEGRLPEAEAETRGALDAMRRILGNDHAETQVAVNNLGIILSDAGRPAEAEAYYKEGLEHGLRVLGEKHPETLASMVNMATFYLKNDQCPRAVPLLDRAIRNFEETMTDAIGLGIARSVRGECRLRSGNRTAALADFLEARRILAEIFPPDHPRLKRVEGSIREAGGTVPGGS